MVEIDPGQVHDVIRRYERDPALHAELLAKFGEQPVTELAVPHTRAIFTAKGIAPVAARLGPRGLLESIVRPSARPVMLIQDNRITGDFVGPDSAVWKDRITDPRTLTLLEKSIPSVGRIEVKNNPDFDWVGTGWLVDDDIVVTNRHVASEFGRLGPNGFIFRTGLNDALQMPRIDFLEEAQRSASLEFAVDSILWIATTNEPDVAFLRVRRLSGRRPLPLKIQLEESERMNDALIDKYIVAIGYPARDSRVPDQDLVQRIFGDVYEKKRLAPGQVTALRAEEMEHDCSTLGGNSGSVLLNLETGRAVGLHFSGLFMETNFAVPAPTIADLLARVQRGELPRASVVNTDAAGTGTTTPAVQTPALTAAPGTFTFQLQIPVEITVRIGATGLWGAPITSLTPFPASLPAGGAASSGDVFETALATARQALANQTDILDLRLGYRFKRGWITDERVVVIEVKKKLSFTELQETGKPMLPPQILGVGVDVRTAPLAAQLESLNIDLGVLEAQARPGLYREPPDLPLDVVKARMRAIFHVSPDSGFPNLKAFLSRVSTHLTATMYEWEPNHISDAIEAAMQPSGRKLKMVTQKKTPAGGTLSAIEDMERRIGDKLSHVWASVGPGKLIPSAYHIKVASRDGQEVWISSGNWKDSNQPDIDPARENSRVITPLRKFNRDWHAIIENDTLATLFQRYIEFDFDEALRIPLEEAEELPQVDLFVPEEALIEAFERVQPTYFDPLELNREMEIQPLLTPDRDRRGRRLFIDCATRMVQAATKKVYVQNQSFSLNEDGGQYEGFFAALREKQRAGLDVRVIFRDPREFSNDVTPLQKALETLKTFGFDTNLIKVQKRCHTKGIIVDGKEVMLGSENLTRAGSLFNRDASLLVRDAEVAQYFEKIFLFDWDTLASQEADEKVGGIRLARTDESTPPGFRRVSLGELLGQS